MHLRRTSKRAKAIHHLELPCIAFTDAPLHDLLTTSSFRAYRQSPSPHLDRDVSNAVRQRGLESVPLDLALGAHVRDIHPVRLFHFQNRVFLARQRDRESGTRGMLATSTDTPPSGIELTSFGGWSVAARIPHRASCPPRETPPANPHLQKPASEGLEMVDALSRYGALLLNLALRLCQLRGLMADGSAYGARLLG